VTGRDCTGQRVGDLRIVYQPDWRRRSLLVVAIAHRRDVYRKR
jgi:mRNA-degrading endonuclease RelE of RelBE toxin-antitoxin system